MLFLPRLSIALSDFSSKVRNLPTVSLPLLVRALNERRERPNRDIRDSGEKRLMVSGVSFWKLEILENTSINNKPERFSLRK